MTQYLGLDVSLKETKLHVLDEAGNRVWRGRCATEPAAISAAVRRYAPIRVVSAVGRKPPHDGRARVRPPKILCAVRIGRYEPTRIASPTSRQGHRDSTSEESTNTVSSLFNLCCGSAECGVEWCARLPHGQHYIEKIVDEQRAIRQRIQFGTRLAMTSYRQIEANRRNALKSTGPKTKSGKQTSRCNAVRHGLTAETVIAALEDAEDYQAFEAAVTADYDAQSAVERELVLRLASALWRLRRATTIETGLFEIQTEHLREHREARQLLPESRGVIHAAFGRAEPDGCAPLHNGTNTTETVPASVTRSDGATEFAKFCVWLTCPTLPSIASADTKSHFGAKRAASSLASMPWIAASHKKEGGVSYFSSKNHRLAKTIVFDIWYYFTAGGSSIHEPEPPVGLPDRVKNRASMSTKAHRSRIWLKHLPPANFVSTPRTHFSMTLRIAKQRCRLFI
jgi:hypothetical protein